MKGKADIPEMNNADLKRMLDQTMTRFENWRIEVERRPNPMMVHSLKNIMSIIESVTSMAERRMEYSYKALVLRMAELVNETSALNMAIVDALKNDDAISEAELRHISGRLFKLIHAAAELARIVQDHFGPHELSAPDGRELLSEGSLARAEGVALGGPAPIGPSGKKTTARKQR